MLDGNPATALSDGDVNHGYFRRRVGKKGIEARWQAIGIWKAGDRLIVEKDGRPTSDRPFDLLFTRSLQAISYELYMQVRAGKPWPDAPPTAEETRTVDVSDFKGASVPASDRAVERTDNAPPDPLAEHKAQLAEEALVVAKFLKEPVASQDRANAASELANRIAKLGKWFGDHYELENRPLIMRQQELRDNYLHPSQEAKALAKSLADAQADFLYQEQQRLNREAAEKARIAAEAQKKLEDEARETGETTPAPVAVPPVEAPRKATSGGLTGRKTSVTTKPTAVVTDYRLLAAWLITGGEQGVPGNECRNMALKAVLDTAAQRMVDARSDLKPGFVVEDKPVARR